VLTWFRDVWRRLYDWWRGRRLLAAQRAGVAIPELTEAQQAVSRVVLGTKLPPDCVSAGPMRGGCAIQVKHDDAWEVFLHHTYAGAATEAIYWVKLQDDELEYRSASKLNRAQRRTFDAERRTRNKKQRPPKQGGNQ
jgi:hypothetical protein